MVDLPGALVFLVGSQVEIGEHVFKKTEFHSFSKENVSFEWSS